MKDKLEKIAQLLPDGFSETGLNKVLSLVEGAVEERVAEEVKLVEAKVSGFLRSKITALQEVARQELEANDEVIRGYRRLKNSLHENSMLSGKVESLNEANDELTESNKLPFKSSETAVVITNETDSSRPSPEAANNIFLTEDVINLSKQEVLKD